MKKIGKFLVVAIVGAISFACSNNEEDGINPPVKENGALVEFILANATRADTEPGVGDENKIDHLEAYVFESDGTLSQYKLFSAPESGDRYSMAITQPQDDMKFLIAVNQNLGDLAGKDYEEALKIISSAPAFTPFSTAEGNTMDAPTIFPMSGWATANVEAPSEDNKTPSTAVIVLMNRLVSKVLAPKVASTFSVSIPDEDLQYIFPPASIPANGVSFDMQGYTLINGLDKTDAFYTWNSQGLEADIWDTWIRTGKTNLVSTFDANGFYTSVYAGAVKSPSSDMFTNDENAVMYIYESKPQEHDETTPDSFWEPTTVCSFIIKGRLTDNDDSNNTVIRYWRANLGQGESYRVFRNSIYKATLGGVNDIGSSTPEGAEQPPVTKEGNASVIIRVEIMPWKVKSFENIIL